jgi:hypothetical protein
MFRRSEVTDNPELAAQMSVRQRMAGLLRNGAMAPQEVAKEIDADPETVKRTARRYKKSFVILSDGRIALLEGTA